MSEKEIKLLNEMKSRCLEKGQYVDEKAKDKFNLLCCLECYVIKYEELQQELKQKQDVIDKAIEYCENYDWSITEDGTFYDTKFNAYDLLSILEREEIMKTKYKFKEIFKLQEMLTEENIPYVFENRTNFIDDKEFTSYQIEIFDKYHDRIVSIIQSFGSYGREKDLLEIIGLLTEEESKCDSVAGWLTAENVMKRIKKYFGREGSNEK